MKFSLPLIGFAVLALGSCGTPQGHVVDDGQYWQRSSVSDAAYMQGPKAQQMLNRDIAGCVSELKELETLGQIREAIPANPHNDKVLSSDELALQAWDEPERVKYLLAEHGNYHDFETCMVAKGWERVKHVPFDVAHNSRKNYMKNHVDYEYMPPSMPKKENVQTQDEGKYSDLND